MNEVSDLEIEFRKTTRKKINVINHNLNKIQIKEYLNTWTFKLGETQKIKMITILEDYFYSDRILYGLFTIGNSLKSEDYIQEYNTRKANLFQFEQENFLVEK